MKLKLSHRILALAFDLTFAGVIYLLLIGRGSPISLYNAPTSAELGYGIGSEVVHSEQVKVILVGILAWTIYILLSVLSLKKTIGQLFVGIYYEGESIIKKILSAWLSLSFLIDKLLKTKISKTEKTNKVAGILGTLLSLITLPGLALFIFIAGFILINPSFNGPDNIGLCGEKFCLVKPNTQCEKNIDLVRSRTVEIVGKEFTGTGFLVSSSLVLTNNHVIEGESDVQIREQSGKISQGKVFKVNPDFDMALVIGQFSEGQHIQFVNPTDFGEGTTDLMAIGYPGSIMRESGTGTLTVTKGIYSAFRHYPEFGIDLVQTDTPANPGNSGGPLVNNCGQVFGMVTLSEKLDPITGTPKEGLNYAISSTTLVQELNKMTQ